MGLCLSKKDVLHRAPRLGIREQMLDLARDSRDGTLMFSGSRNNRNDASPSASIVSSALDTDSISFHHRRAKAAAAPASAAAAAADEDGEDDEDESYSVTTETTNGTNVRDVYGSPAVRSMESSFGMESVTQSYARHRAGMRVDESEDEDVSFSLPPPSRPVLLRRRSSKPHTLLEINEEDEEQLDNDEDDLSELNDDGLMKKTTRRSLHVFGEAFVRSNSSCAHPVFPASRYFSEEEDLSQQERRRQWDDNNTVDSGSEFDDSESALSSSSSMRSSFRKRSSNCNVNSSSSSAPRAAFMAVPPSAPVFQHRVVPNFAHMTPSAASAFQFPAATTAYPQNKNGRLSFSSEISTTTYAATDSGEDVAAPREARSVSSATISSFPATLTKSLPKSQLSNPAFARSSSASSSFLGEDNNSSSTMERFRAHFQASAKSRIHPSSSSDVDFHRTSFGFQDEEDNSFQLDDGMDSDDSNDLFEIGNLEAALGSLSSSKEQPQDIVYPRGSEFRDPGISHSTKLPLSTAFPQRNNHHRQHFSEIRKPPPRTDQLRYKTAAAAAASKRRRQPAFA